MEQALTIIASVTTILAIASTIWRYITKFKLDQEKKRLQDKLEEIHEISLQSLWEPSYLPKERSSDTVSLDSIRIISETGLEDERVKRTKSYNNKLRSQINEILWSKSRLMSLETAKEVTEVWVISHNLKPDRSDSEIGKFVNSNLRMGKSYKYFFPNNITNEEIQLLIKNIGAEDLNKRPGKKVDFIPLNQDDYQDLFRDKCNILLLFYHDVKAIPKMFKEVYLTISKERAEFWQAHRESESTKLKKRLDMVLKDNS